jgi:polygalacturonase
VEDCFVESEDDAICLKSTSAKPCSQIRVTGCTVRTHHGGLKIGTESMGDIYDVIFDRNHVIDAREGAVKFCAEDGGSVHDVTVSKLTVELADTPIFLRLGGRMRTYREGDPKLSISTMKRITLKDIQIADSTRVGMLITGFPGHAIEDVTIENLYVKMKGELNSLAEGDLRLPEAVKDYPEVWMFGPLIPAYGVYVRHAVGVTMRRTEFKEELPDQRPAFVLEDVQRSAIQGCDLTGSSNSSWMATLRDCREVTLHAVTTQSPLVEMVRVQGSSSAAIRLGELKAPSGTLVKLEAGAKQEAIDR